MVSKQRDPQHECSYQTVVAGDCYVSLLLFPVLGTSLISCPKMIPSQSVIEFQNRFLFLITVSEPKFFPLIPSFARSFVLFFLFLFLRLRRALSRLIVHSHLAVLSSDRLSFLLMFLVPYSLFLVCVELAPKPKYKERGGLPQQRNLLERLHKHKRNRHNSTADPDPSLLGNIHMSRGQLPNLSS